MIRQLKTTISDFLKLFIIYLPGESGRKIRYWYYKNKFKRCGKDLKIDEGVIILNPEWISVGDNVWIDRYALIMAGPVSLPERTICKKRLNKDFIYCEGELILEDNVHISPFCTLQAHGGIHIGKNCGIANGVKIFTVTVMPQDTADPSRIVYMTPLHTDTVCRQGAVVLGENIGVGVYSTILPGVSIKKNSAVAPMSVVFTSFSENSCIKGNPARRFRARFRYETKG